MVSSIPINNYSLYEIIFNLLSSMWLFKKTYFIAENLLYPMVLLCFFRLLFANKKNAFLSKVSM